MPAADRYRVGMRRLRGFRIGSKQISNFKRMSSHAGSGDSLPFDQRHIPGDAGLHGVCEYHGDAHRRTVATGNKATNRRGLTDGHAGRANASTLANLNIHAAAYTIPFPDKYTVPAIANSRPRVLGIGRRVARYADCHAGRRRHRNHTRGWHTSQTTHHVWLQL